MSEKICRKLLEKKENQRLIFRVSLTYIKFFLPPPSSYDYCRFGCTARDHHKTCGRSIGFTTSSPRWGCGRKTRRSCFWCVVVRVLFSPGRFPTFFSKSRVLQPLRSCLRRLRSLRNECAWNQPLEKSCGVPFFARREAPRLSFSRSRSRC